MGRGSAVWVVVAAAPHIIRGQGVDRRDDDAGRLLLGQVLGGVGRLRGAADDLTRDGGHGSAVKQEAMMPLVDIQLIKGIFTPDQKKNMITKVTDAMVAVEGEALRGGTWVRIQEIESGQWAIGGKPLTSDAVKAMAAG